MKGQSAQKVNFSHRFIKFDLIHLETHTHKHKQTPAYKTKRFIFQKQQSYRDQDEEVLKQARRNKIDMKMCIEDLLVAHNFSK